MTTQVSSFLDGSSPFLQITRTDIKSWIGLKFRKISQATADLAALEHPEKSL